jgi:surface protein
MATLYSINDSLIRYSGKVLSQGDAPIPVYRKSVRVKVNDGLAPHTPPGEEESAIRPRYHSAVLVEGTNDTYDVYGELNNPFNHMLSDCINVTEIVSADSSGVEDFSHMCYVCSNLTKVNLFDTSSATRVDGMFALCTSLPTVPLFDTSNVTDFSSMFWEASAVTGVPLFDTSKGVDMDWFLAGTSITECPLFDTSSATGLDSFIGSCFELQYVPDLDVSSCLDADYICVGDTNVVSGALNLYNKLAALDPLPSHEQAFTNCGKDTVTGAAELAQIPDSWKSIG